MKLLKGIISIFGLFVLCSSQILAQNSPAKYGEISLDELQMAEYELDKNAPAVVLFDYLSLLEDRFSHHYTYHKRVKIFNRNGYQYADFRIKYYKREGVSNQRFKIKATCYNLTNGEIIKTQLDEKNVFFTQLSEDIGETSFSIPGVQDGSVIEFEIKDYSGILYSIPWWYFQCEIPTVHSEFILETPTYHSYNKRFLGFGDVPEYTTKTEDRTKASPYSSYGYYVLVDHYIARNVPAFETESYLSSINNYLLQVRYEVSSIDYPFSLSYKYATTWQKINELFLESSHFGGRIKKAPYLKTEIKEFTTQYTTPFDKMIAAYNHIKNTIVWNGKKTLFAPNDLKEAHWLKKGTSAEINLMLVAFLKQLEINAAPVVLSTRQNGIFNSAFPTIDQFDYVVAGAVIDGVTYLLDATTKNLPMGMLPVQCLNTTGMMILESGIKEVSLIPAEKDEKIIRLNLSINENSTIGKLQMSNKGYAAFLKRNSIDDLGGEENYIQNLKEENNTLGISNVEIKNATEPSEPLIEKYDVEIEEGIDKSVDYISLSSD